MNTRLLLAPATLGAALAAAPAQAASGPFLSLGNTDFVVLVAFVLFLAVLAYFKVPGLLARLLDKRSTDIRSELDEARSLREEAQALLASYERKSRETQDQADRIIAQARQEAELAAEQARADLKLSVERRLQTAESQIASAEAAAIKEVRDRAAAVAVEAAREVVAEQMSEADRSTLIDSSIATVGAKLH
jgi:F-type H+-transporting ATPase subunit b